MDLFSNQPTENINLLPKDGAVFYFGKIMPLPLANKYFDCLLKTIEWVNDEAIIFGKKIITKRKVAWYGDKAFEYTYSKSTKKALPFTNELQLIKTLIEDISGETFNSCLLNLYHSGDEGMGWHSDAEKELKTNGAIASVSFGADRRFLFRHKQTKETVTTNLEHGSLLIMKGVTQTNWLHRLPTTKTVQRSRINLTFRTIIDS